MREKVRKEETAIVKKCGKHSGARSFALRRPCETLSKGFIWLTEEMQKFNHRYCLPYRHKQINTLTSPFLTFRGKAEHITWPWAALSYGDLPACHDASLWLIRNLWVQAHYVNRTYKHIDLISIQLTTGGISNMWKLGWVNGLSKNTFYYFTLKIIYYFILFNFCLKRK